MKSGPLAGQGCRCEDDHCHYCIKQGSGDTCKRCRDGYYNLGGQCLETCPDNTIPEDRRSLFGRDCLSGSPTTSPTPSPTITFVPVCVDGMSDDGNKIPCSCQDSNCSSCEKVDGGQDVCTVCSNNKLLLNGVCVDTCSETTFPIGTQSTGRFCKEGAFMCFEGGLLLDFNLEPDMCVCPENTGGPTKCGVCSIENGQAQCSVCSNFTFNSGGVCMDTCPIGTTELETDSVSGLGYTCV